MAARLLALLFAVALVAAALAYRSHATGNGGGGSNNPRLTCATELQAVCKALAGRADTTVEAAGTTADRLVQGGDDPGVDGWITVGPWAQMVDEARQRNGKPTLFAAPSTVARSPVALVVWPDRRAALEAKCEGPVTWKCLGVVAKGGTWAASGGPAAWGPVKVGVDDPHSSGVGLSAIAAGTVAVVGRPDVSSTDLDTDTFRDWLSGLAHAVPTGDPALERMLAAGPSVLDLDLSVKAVAARLVDSSASRTKPVLVYPAPMTAAAVELSARRAGAGGGRVGRLVDGRGADALRSAGWEAPGASDAGGPLPSAGVLDALRSAWQDASR